MTVKPHTHLANQAALKNIPMAAVMEILQNPGIKYGSTIKNERGQRVPRCCQKHGVQQQTWTGEAHGYKLALAVYTCCDLAITLWLDQQETALRPDQIAKGVTKYRGRNGEWRK